MMEDLVQQKWSVPVQENLKLGAYADGFYFHLKLGIFLTNSVRKSDVFSAVIRTAKSTARTSWLWKVGAGESCETTEKQHGPSAGAKEKESDQSSWHSWAFLLGAPDRMKQNNTDKNHVPQGPQKSLWEGRKK